LLKLAGPVKKNTKKGRTIGIIYSILLNTVVNIEAKL